MGGRVCAQDVAASTSTPSNRQQIVVERPSFVIGDPSSVNQMTCHVGSRTKLVDTGSARDVRCLPASRPRSAASETLPPRMGFAEAVDIWLTSGPRTAFVAGTTVGGCDGAD